MGKGILIFTLLSIVILTTLIMTVVQDSSDMVILTSAQEFQGDASNLSDYALNYAMKQVVKGIISGDDSVTYDDFNVLNGKILELKYDFDFDNRKNIIQLLANVSWIENGKTVNHQAEAHLEFVASLNSDSFKTGSWLFSEGSGSDVDDKVGDKGASAVNKDNIEDDWCFDRFNNEGKAMHFTNSSQSDDEYFTVNDAPELDLQIQGSCEAWIFLESPFVPYAGILHKGERSNYTDEAYSLQFGQTGKEIAFSIRNSDNQQQMVIGPADLETDKWYYVVGTWNQDKIKVWVDGVNVASEDNTVNNARNSDGSLQIGSQLTNGNTDPNSNSLLGFNGKIDDVAVRNKAYEDDEIMQMYLQGSLAAHWQFDEGEGTDAFDSSLNNNNGTLFDGYHDNGISLPLWVDGKFGKGLQFNGYDNMVTVPNSEAISLQQQGTICFWAKPFSLDNNCGYLHKGDRADLNDECYSYENFPDEKKLDLVVGGTSIEDDNSGSGNHHRHWWFRHHCRFWHGRGHRRFWWNNWDNHRYGWNCGSNWNNWGHGHEHEYGWGNGQNNCNNNGQGNGNNSNGWGWGNHGNNNSNNGNGQNNCNNNGQGNGNNGNGWGWGNHGNNNGNNGNGNGYAWGYGNNGNGNGNNCGNNESGNQNGNGHQYGNGHNQGEGNGNGNGYAWGYGWGHRHHWGHWNGNNCGNNQNSDDKTEGVIHVISDGTPNINSWNFIAVSWDSQIENETQTISHYVNGTYNSEEVPSYIDKNESNLNIGAKTREFKDTTDGNNSFNGVMDDVRIFFRKLNETELSALEDYDPISNGYGKEGYKIIYWRR